MVKEGKSMAMEITNNYNSYAVQGMAGNDAANSTKKKEMEKTTETASQKVYRIM